MNKISKIFFVDPMSYGNLALYDYNLLSNVKNIDFEFFGNKNYAIKSNSFNCNLIYNYSNQFFILKPLSYLVTQIRLFFLIRKFNPKVVHFQWLKLPNFDFWLLKQIKGLKINIIYTAHNVLPHNSGNKYKVIYKKIYDLVDCIIVHSERTKEDLVNNFNLIEEKIRVVPHGILDFNEADEEKVNMHIAKIKGDNILDGKVVFSTLGYLSKYKGIDFIVDSWKANFVNNDSICLIVAGSGNYDKLDELYGNDNAIIINRFLEIEEFVAILRLSNYILLPYREISQSGLLLTALNENKRIIVSNKGGLTDPFVFGEIGYIMNNLTCKELTRLIYKAIEDIEKEPSKEVWEAIEANYDWVKIGCQTKKIYQSFLE
ncbi:glycosyltransferase involved in cell wall biosynthesis [Maribacter vaceletii]|uniref:Glycosyltransferase involved in cell wall biosynthesis n=1 Tax=Maribacter vaceletii TaxID=1206816 RepID=A0A495DSU6_9FLAO|nr:glycosyltransferase [Maribacter vaceletii]RKR07178.1 glycosyltransferase involved in cell wall biosynthesis [Maribacter vaceletii]